MHILVEAKMSTATGDFGAAAARLTMKLEGRKTWKAHNQLRFETSRHNLDAFVAFWPAAEVQDVRSLTKAAEALTQEQVASTAVIEPAFKMPPLDFQLENFERFKDQLQWAIFSEQGTGKTKVACDILSHRALKGTVTGAIILSFPKGVHAQWVEEQMPKHMWDNAAYHPYIWEGKKPPEWLGKSTNSLQVISGNIDMLRGVGSVMLKAFAAHHGQRLMILVDESDSIGNLESSRNKKLRELAQGTPQRAIMTGTPIAVDLTDEWAQFYFLNPDIIGHKYLTSFRAQFCNMGGFENKAVIGHKNVELFKKLTAPYIFRATKKELNLPEKIHDSVVFDLHPNQKRMIREIKEQFFTQLKSGEVVSVKHGAAALIRIQQISNGFAVDEQGNLTRIENPRMDVLLDLLRQAEAPHLIWCRYKEDVRWLKEMLPGSVSIYGEDDSDARAAAKEAFITGKADTLIATPAAAGRGLDGLQKVCSFAAYYSNSYNAIERWQSEDRIHRMGMAGTATYFDLIARGSADRAMLANLKKKKDLSTMVLDDFKEIMEEVGQ